MQAANPEEVIQILQRHTQGEWFVSTRHIPVTLNDYPDQTPQFDSVEVAGLSAGGGIALVHCKPGHGNPNARLIAAAPDLLAALKDARERMMGSSPAIKALIAKTDAAIAKATQA